MCDLICFLINLGMNRNAHMNGEAYGYKYPINVSELGEGQLGDKAWFQKALRSHKTIDGNTTVTKITCTNFQNNGLLSDIGRVKLEYEGGSGPAEVILKFAPIAFETRITTDLFKLSQTEYHVYKAGPEKLGFTRTPKLYYADFNYKSNNYCLMLESIGLNDDAKFYNILEPNKGSPTGVDKKSMSYDQAVLCLKQLAKFHADFPDEKIKADKDLNFFPRSSDKLYKMFESEAKKHWKTSGVSAYAPGGIQHSGWTYKIPASFTELANDVLGNFTNVLWYGAEGCEYSGLTHGDPRIDNWFFYENDTQVGVLDFQLMLISNQPADIAWILSCSCDMEMLANNEKKLLEEYLNAYETCSGKAVDREMWMEEYALGYIGCIGKSIIGAGGIDASGDNADIVVGTMNWLLEMAFDGWRRNNVADVWSKYRAGKLKSQLKNPVKVPGFKPTDMYLGKFADISFKDDGKEIELTQK